MPLRPFFLAILFFSFVNMPIQAAHLQVPKYLVSKQGLDTEQYVDLTLQLVPETQYGVGDVLTFEVNDGEILGAGALSSADGSITAGLMNSTGSSVSYRITSTNGLNVGKLLTLNDLRLSLKPLQLMERQTISFYNYGYGGHLVESVMGEPLLVLAEQFTAEVSHPLDRHINVTEGMREFVGSGTDKHQDQLQFVLRKQPKQTFDQLLHPAEGRRVQVLLQGNFGFLGKADQYGEIVGAESHFSLSPTTASERLQVFRDHLLIELDSRELAPEQTMTLTVDIAKSGEEQAEAPLSSQEFSAKVIQDYIEFDGFSLEKTENLAMGQNWGAWQSSGAHFIVPFLPYREGMSVSVVVSSLSSRQLPIMAKIYFSDGRAPLVIDSLAEIQPNTILDLEPALSELALSDDVAIELLIDEEPHLISVHSQYRLPDDITVIRAHKRNH